MGYRAAFEVSLMPIKTTCPHCHKAYTFADTLGGKKVRCKACEEVFRVPPPDEDEERPARKKRRAAPPPDEEVEEVVAAGDEEDDYDDRPSRRRPVRKAKGGAPLWVWLAAGGGGLLLIVVVVVLVLVLAGGGNSKVTKENYDKLKAGMSEAEVTAILGSPDEKKDGGNPSAKVWSWKNGNSSITVTFTNGKVTGQQWYSVNTSLK
jgi:hypothetical protein